MQPRDVYERYLDDLLKLLQLPGKARCDSLGGEVIMPEKVLPLAGKLGPESGIALSTLSGVVMDETDAELAGAWSGGRWTERVCRLGLSLRGARN